MELPRHIVLDGPRNIITNPVDIRVKLDYYRQLSATGLSKLCDSDYLALQIDAHRFFNYIPGFYADTYPTKIWRVSFNKRINGAPRAKLTKVTQLIGPPLGGSSKFGRGNLPGESVFYGALDPITALWETRPQKGDYITMSEWSIRPDERLYLHYVFHPDVTMANRESRDAYAAHRREQGRLHPTQLELTEDLFRFYAEQFMKPVSDTEHWDYLFSAICASNLIQSPKDANDGTRIESVLYPSVKRERGVSNVAIANDVVLKRLKPDAITVYDVAETYYHSMSPGSTEPPIGVGPAQIRITNLDVERDVIHNPDPRDEMDILIRAHLKTRGVENPVIHYQEGPGTKGGSA